MCSISVIHQWLCVCIHEQCACLSFFTSSLISDLSLFWKLDTFFLCFRNYLNYCLVHFISFSYMILFVFSENSSCLLNLILSTVLIMNLFIIISSRWHLYSKLKFHSPPHSIISHACIHTSACPTTFFCIIQTCTF